MCLYLFHLGAETQIYTRAEGRERQKVLLQKSMAHVEADTHLQSVRGHAR